MVLSPALLVSQSPQIYRVVCKLVAGNYDANEWWLLLKRVQS